MLKTGNIQETPTFEAFKVKYGLDPVQVTFDEILSRTHKESEYFSAVGEFNPAMARLKVPGVTIVRTPEEARRAVAILRRFPERVHAWDTETVDLSVKAESPVLNGKVVCLQAFLGMDAPFWDGPRLFVDNFGDSAELVQEFKEYFEDPDMQKVWFNYGFDRHVVENHGIRPRGFAADVMQMARLVDPSRMPGDYSLSKCTAFYEQEIRDSKKREHQGLREELLLGVSEQGRFWVFFTVVVIYGDFVLEWWSCTTVTIYYSDHIPLCLILL